MPLWFLTILVVIQVLLPDPNYKPISDESAGSSYYKIINNAFTM